MVRLDTVSLILLPWLGGQFLRTGDVCGCACAVLNAFDAARDDFEALYKRLDSLIFSWVHRLTQGDMRVFLDDGRTVRVKVSDIAQMADELMYLVLRQQPRSPWQYQRVRDYAMTHDSLSALRALYVDFASFQTEEERAVIARTAKNGYPAFRWRAWLNNE